jgi:hypothetical protein
MPAVLWSGRPPDAKLLELLRGRGIRVVDEAGADVVALGAGQWTVNVNFVDDVMASRLPR